MPQSLMTKTFAKYLRMGIIPRKVRGNWKDGDYMYSLYHDNVQYTIDDMGDYEIDSDVSYILDCLDARDLMIERNHEVISAVYNYAKSTIGSDVWVRVGCGQQLNCTLGDRDGEFAHFVMDFVNPSAFDEAVSKIKKKIKEQIGEEPEFTPSENFVLMITGQGNGFIFEGFSHPKVDVLNLDDIEGGHK
jgi:glycogen debranching enzyme